MTSQIGDKHNDETESSGSYMETQDELMKVYDELKHTFCQFRGCEEVANELPLRYHVYNPEYLEIDLPMCNPHKRYAKKILDDYFNSVHALWEFKGKCPFTIWECNNTTWYNNTFLKAIIIILQHIGINLRNIMELYNGLAVPDELYYDETVLIANQAQCYHVIQERGTYGKERKEKSNMYI